MNDTDQEDLEEQHPWECERCTTSNQYSRCSCHSCWRVRGSEMCECPSCHFYNPPGKRSCGVCCISDSQINISLDKGQNKRSPVIRFHMLLTICVCGIPSSRKFINPAPFTDNKTVKSWYRKRKRTNDKSRTGCVCVFWAFQLSCLAFHSME
jgi:hypothetical protein